MADDPGGYLDLLQRVGVILCLYAAVLQGQVGLGDRELVMGGLVATFCMEMYGQVAIQVQAIERVDLLYIGEMKDRFEATLDRKVGCVIQFEKPFDLATEHVGVEIVQFELCMPVVVVRAAGVEVEADVPDRLGA